LVENSIVHALIIALGVTSAYYLLTLTTTFQQAQRRQRLLMGVPTYFIMALLIEIVLRSI
jgi:uncharacterized membrane protein